MPASETKSAAMFPTAAALNPTNNKMSDRSVEAESRVVKPSANVLASDPGTGTPPLSADAPAAHAISSSTRARGGESENQPNLFPQVMASAPLPSSPSSPSATRSITNVQMLHAPHHPEFAAELGARLLTWTRQGVHQAELRLNPAELGPVQVSIQLQGQQAQIGFVADVAATRDALQASLPQLAAALAREGLQLSGGSVQSQTQQQAQQQSQQQAQGREQAPGGDGVALASRGPVATPPPGAPAAISRSQRLLDLYA